METKDVGVKKSRIPISIIIILGSIAFILTFICMWWEYASQDSYKYLNANAIQVEATIDSYRVHYFPDSNKEDWWTYYEYQSSWGTVYCGHYATYTNESGAKKQLGKKVTIYVDPNSDWSAKFIPSVDYERALKDAIIYSCPIPIVLYFLIYRCVYRNILNKKIRKKAYGRYYKSTERVIWDPQPDTIKVGEVTKVRKWIVCYVKVRYLDEKGITREKWARSWFTHKEAKFLERKRYINIVPYKNTYGILEEMPIEKRSKGK